MSRYVETVTIEDGLHERAVEVTLDVPSGRSVNNLKELAEKAWQTPGKEIEVRGGIMVRVRDFGR